VEEGQRSIARGESNQVSGTADRAVFPAPPAVAGALLRRSCPAPKLAEVEGDFLEAYGAWINRRGHLYARRRYWREVALFTFWTVVGRFRVWREARQTKRHTREQTVAGREPDLAMEPIQRGSPRSRWEGILNDLLQDIRYGIRTLTRDPGFTLVAVLILTLGIGANSTLFTMVNSTFLQDPPLIEAPGELVGFTMIDDNGPNDAVGYPDYEWFRDENESFAGILAYGPSSTAVAVGGGDEVAQADAWVVSGNYFDVLGVGMALGRAFTPEESVTPNTHPVAVISDGFWKRFFGANPDIVGSTLRVNGNPLTVIGVTPAGFRDISPVETPPDVYLPIMMQGTIIPGSESWLVRRDDNILIWLRMVGRLAPGVSFEAAQANVEVMFSQWESEFAGWLESIDYVQGSTRIALTTGYKFDPRTGSELRRLLTLLFMVAGVVLLIAIANLSILLLARAAARQREVGIRAALGAGRGRVVRQLLTESCLLALLGGMGGLILTFWSARLASTLMPVSFAVDFKPDMKVAAFTVGVSVLTAVLFGLAPAWQLSRADIVAFLHRGSSRGPRASLRNILVVAQIALSIVLVTGAGLFVRSLSSARSVDLGFDPENKLAVSVQLGNHGYDEVSGTQFVVAMLDRPAWRPRQRAG